jgi:beta-glucosidase
MRAVTIRWNPMMAVLAVVLALFGVLAGASSSVSAAGGDARVDALIGQMTLDEKLTLLSGAPEPPATNQYQAGFLPGIPRLGIPSLRLSDGPPGTITREPSVGMTQTNGVAATFSRADARRNGIVIGRDARALGIDVTLQPFINMLRDPTWNRAFNVFGEDPLLAGITGAEEIRGIQSQGVMAQAKHYIAYDEPSGSPFAANNVVVDERTLHEIYLAPFADAVDAGVASIMCSYNRLNGPYACDNNHTLTDLLRGELGFRGFVTSDWGATHATDFINAGLDMEMPGEGTFGNALPAYLTKPRLKAAIADGTVPLSRIDEAVGRILSQYDRFGLLSGASKHEITPEPVAADERVVQRTAEHAAVLLKNDHHALPLRRRDLRALALIGPGAGQTMATNGAGEKAGGLVEFQQIGAFDVLRERFADDPRVHLTYAVADDMTGTPVPASALSHDGRPGLLRTDPATGETTEDARLDFTRAGGNALPAGSAFTWSGSLTVPSSGSYRLYVQSLGAAATLTVDGTPVATTGSGLPAIFGVARAGTVKPTDIGPLPTTDGLANARATVDLTAGAHTITIEEMPDVSGDPVQVRLNWVTPEQQRVDHDAAVAAARGARTAVVFAWSGGSLDATLPEGQDQLIDDIAAANPNTVVVLNTNLPVAMPWLQSVKSVLEMWFPGDTGGVAAANVLLGDANPAGRLPFTWPATLDQGVANQPDRQPERTGLGVHADGTPCTTTGGDCTTTYSEGIFIGYRWFDQQGLNPLYPFGHGRSYSSFAYSRLRVTPARDGGLDVRFRVRNTGRAAGDEVPQVYLGAPEHPPADVDFAVRALAAYGRVRVAPGSSRTVRLHIPARQIEYWSSSGWTRVTGPRPVYVGTSSRDIRLTGNVNVPAR